MKYWKKPCIDNNKRYLLYKMISVTSVLLFVPILGVLSLDSDPKNWDILIFTQRWPITACSQWKQHAINNTCSFPQTDGIWTIHGIWPTKFGTKGPLNCNNTWPFNETIIDPIKTTLENYWTNVENNTQLNSLWKHEWIKHGTCAAVLPQLSNELKYFTQGIDWIEKYNMKNILYKSNITPNQNGYLLQEIFDSIQKVLNKNVIVECVTDKKSRLSWISEIRICFDKELNLTDCDLASEGLGKHIRKYGKLHTNCNIKKLVVYPIHIENYQLTYPTVLPLNVEERERRRLDTINKVEKYLYLRKIYNTIKLVMWATF